MNKNLQNNKTKSKNQGLLVIGIMLLIIAVYELLGYIWSCISIGDFMMALNLLGFPFIHLIILSVGIIFIILYKKDNVSNETNKPIIPNQDDDNGFYHPSRNSNVERKVSCPSCKKFVDDNSLFCPECGSKLNKFCKYCGNENEAGSSYCNECGRKLED